MFFLLFREKVWGCYFWVNNFCLLTILSVKPCLVLFFLLLQNLFFNNAILGLLMPFGWLFACKNVLLSTKTYAILFFSAVLGFFAFFPKKLKIYGRKRTQKALDLYVRLSTCKSIVSSFFFSLRFFLKKLCFLGSLHLFFLLIDTLFEKLLVCLPLQPKFSWGLLFVDLYFFCFFVVFCCKVLLIACDPAVVSYLFFQRKVFFFQVREKWKLFHWLDCCFCLRTKLCCLFWCFFQAFCFLQRFYAQKKADENVFFYFFSHCWWGDRLCWLELKPAAPFV